MCSKSYPLSPQYSFQTRAIGVDIMRAYGARMGGHKQGERAIVMLTSVELHSYKPYHVSDTDEILDELMKLVPPSL